MTDEQRRQRHVWGMLIGLMMMALGVVRMLDRGNASLTSERVE